VQGPVGATGATGSPGTPGTNGTSVTSSTLPVGDPNCPNGGSKFTSANATTYACTGNTGSPGTNGISVTSTPLPVGDPNCPNGGSKFTAANATTYACTGATGASGVVTGGETCQNANGCTWSGCGGCGAAFYVYSWIPYAQNPTTITLAAGQRAYVTVSLDVTTSDGAGGYLSWDACVSPHSATSLASLSSGFITDTFGIPNPTPHQIYLPAGTSNGRPIEISATTSGIYAASSTGTYDIGPCFLNYPNTYVTSNVRTFNALVTYLVF
jgi:hypothetical protein